jgi:hypothetical protein
MLEERGSREPDPQSISIYPLKEYLMIDLAPRCFKMIAVRTQPGTQLTEIDVESSGAQLANEVSQGFAACSNAQLPGGPQVLPAQKPVEPIRPIALNEIRWYLSNAQQRRAQHKLTFAFTSKGYKACRSL